MPMISAPTSSSGDSSRNTIGREQPGIEQAIGGGEEPCTADGLGRRTPDRGSIRSSVSQRRHNHDRSADNAGHGEHKAQLNRPADERRSRGRNKPAKIHAVRPRLGSASRATVSKRRADRPATARCLRDAKDQKTGQERTAGRPPPPVVDDKITAGSGQGHRVEVVQRMATVTAQDESGPHNAASKPAVADPSLDK